MRWLLRQHWATLVMQVYIHHSRQTHPQRVLRQLVGIDMNTNRYPLDNFDPVASRVLRWQQRERAACTGADTVDGAAVFHIAAVNVRFDLNRLADTHVMQLGFLEVGINP